MSKYERECLRICFKAGLRELHIRYGGKHLKIVSSKGLVVCPSTPSDHRWQQNLRSIARRISNDR